MNWQDEQKKVATGVTGKQEPVVWVDKNEIDWLLNKSNSPTAYVKTMLAKRADALAKMPLYTHPQPKREWVGLTDEEFESIAKRKPSWALFDFYRLIEAKLKEKNSCNS